MGMSVEFVCSCEAAFNISTDEDAQPVWYLAYRFADAHVSCGYMTEPRKDPSRETGKVEAPPKEIKE